MNETQYKFQNITKVQTEVFYEKEKPFLSLTAEGPMDTGAIAEVRIPRIALSSLVVKDKMEGANRSITLALTVIPEISKDVLKIKIKEG